MLLIKFNLLSGKFIKQVNIPNTISNRHNRTNITSIEIDTFGNVYVLNSTDSLIYKFSASGRLLLTWGGKGEFDGKFKEPSSLAIDKYNKIYVADSKNYRIQKFDSTGHFITKWGSKAVTNDHGIYEFGYLDSIAVDNNLNVYVNDGREVMKKFHSDGDYISKVKIKIASKSLRYFKVNALGNIYISTSHRTLEKYNKNLHLLDAWGQVNIWESGEGFKKYNSGFGRGQHTGMVAMVFDSQNNIYTLDLKKSSVQKFAKHGKYIKQWGEFGMRTEQFSSRQILSMAINSLDQIYVFNHPNWGMSPDYFDNKIQKYNKYGKLLQTITFPKKNSITMETRSIAIDKYDNIYIPEEVWTTDYPSPKYVKITIHVYNKNLTKLREIKFPKKYYGQVTIKIDKRRNILYVKTGKDVLKCTLSGKILTGWETGNGNQVLFKNGRWGYVHGKTLSIYSNSGILLKNENLPVNANIVAEDKFGNIYISNSRTIYKKLTSPDVDHDGVINEKDAFPFNRYEWVDTDHDGIGNNADKDDDNDGLSDVIEKAHKLNPLKASDALADFDHDGFSNIMEINAGTNIRSAKSHPIWTPIIMGNIITFIPSHK